ncbi:phenylalanine--tRNA ligase subunit beta [Lactococcus insecticola]|uniref:Phenylalanine--tRNA ligase beta subunit n=1 Tax=Pseudolactococcus insecticola TaxID=2709158 RepID=A0A6A0B6P1_9LACT|nr:phenylalanine--tRNA ligase subunit beta [Lactococcus insecticola]GFH40942.1 phenylalanine--tRNA ligase beta subunit [Lactococcus insecticola]
MQVSYNWLKELVNIDVPAHDLSEKMSTSGIEVEGVTTRAAGLSKLVVGEVISMEAIPETHLNICQVNIGETEPTQIVCGAPNVKAGIKVIVALPGARIAGNHKIKKGKIRGVESLGMICSLQEIGFPESIVPKAYADGIYYLPETAENGAEIFDYLDMNDEVLELSITPNRADALSMRGVAHEVAAIYDNKKVSFDDKVVSESDEKTADKIAVDVATDKVITYKMRIIEDVKIGPSPQWLQNRLMSEDIRPINNVVDVTNFVLLYFGQPLHAFDYATFDEKKIVVRQAEAGEKLTTLDSVERELSTDDIVITVAGKPVALAGVMGGENTEITDKSTSVALESAIFDGTSIRKTSQKYNLRSEASARFEKGINQADVEVALDYAAAMIAELAGGKVSAGVVSNNDFTAQDVIVSITLDKINRALGLTLNQADVVAIFDKLGFTTLVTADTFAVTVPPRRWDIAIEADLVEEIARIYGYDNIPNTLPNAGNTIGQLTPMQKFRRDIRTNLEGAGLSEVISYSLTTPEKAVQFTTLPTEHLTTLAMPMSEERSTLRLNLTSGMLDIVRYNLARGNDTLALYEVGQVFAKFGNESDNRPTELPQVALALTGKAYDFYDIKGVVENLLIKFSDVRFEADTTITDLHPGRTARVLVGDTPVGFVGQVHPTTAKAYDISETYVAALDLTALLDKQPEQVIFTDIPKFQASKRDIALLVNRTATNQEILDVIAESKVKTLAKTELFDVYTGDNVAADKKSLAYTLTFQSADAQLTDDEITAAVTKITKKLSKFGAEVR